VSDTLSGILTGLGVIFLLGLMSLFSGTLVYWLWPVAIPAAFPGLVASGVLAAKLSWWASVCLTWILGILIKSTQTNNNRS
jgi:hypothetical protein